MNSKNMVAALFAAMFSLGAQAEDVPTYFGLGLCNYSEYKCITVSKGDSWESLFPDETQRDLVQRLNRTYNNLWPPKQIVVPKDLAHATIYSLSPFPLKVEPQGEKQIIVDQDKLAWVAYDEKGNLVKWGPISSGADRCSDNSSPTCRSITGTYRIFSREGSKCKSGVFPLGKGGAKMPYCMYFHKGVALHGSDDIPGYRASHGCIRMFTRDAKWLNENWTTSSTDKNGWTGTLVTVRPVTATNTQRTKSTGDVDES